ncbi:hypothetical protein RJ640_008739, partial [Escallonia rubra]
VLGFLKILDLSYSPHLIGTPEFSILPKLKRLILKGCYSLVEVHESIGDLETSLVMLNLKGCKSLRKLPRTIGRLKVLETLIISGCSSLDQLPEEMRMMESLREFLADGIDFGLVYRTWKEETSRPALRENPQHTWFSFPPSLGELSLVDCNLSDDAFSKIGSINLPSLKSLKLSKNPITFLPDCLKGISGPYWIELNRCPKLQMIETPMGSERKWGPHLYVAHCESLERIRGPALDTWSVVARGCEKLVEIQNEFVLEPLEDVDAETTNCLQLYGLQSTPDTEVTTSAILGAASACSSAAFDLAFSFSATVNAASSASRASSSLRELIVACDGDDMSLSNEEYDSSGEVVESADLRLIRNDSKLCLSTSEKFESRGVAPISKLSPYEGNKRSMLGLAELTKDTSVSGDDSYPYDLPFGPLRGSNGVREHTLRMNDIASQLKGLDMEISEGCVDTLKSTSGYVFMLAEGAVSWKSAKHSLMAAHTMEAEFVACFEASCHDYNDLDYGVKMNE